MNHVRALLRRLQEIEEALRAHAAALALIGQGSTGIEQDRLDEFSDLDFIVIARPGSKHEFAHMHWLSAIHPVAHFFKITTEGYKLLFEDGVFCEFAVFEPAELETPEFTHGIWSSPGRVLWQRAGFEMPAMLFKNKRAPSSPRDLEWLLGEVLTNLFVGLLRYHRGEKLSAARFIQSYAIDRIIELSEMIEPPVAIAKDFYTLERRYEQRFPMTSKNLPQFMQGYEHSLESARAILGFLEEHFEVNSKTKELILKLLTRDSNQPGAGFLAS